MSPGLRWLIYPHLVGELLQRTGHDRCGTWKAVKTVQHTMWFIVYMFNEFEHIFQGSQ
jgi:hypothetical protein